MGNEHDSTLPAGANPFDTIGARDLAILRMILREEVRNGCADAVKDVREDQDDLRAIVCGRADSDQGGLISRIQTLETKATLAQWLAGIALGSSTAALVSLVMMVLTHQLRL